MSYSYTTIRWFVHVFVPENQAIRIPTGKTMYGSVDIARPQGRSIRITAAHWDTKTVYKLAELNMLETALLCNFSLSKHDRSFRALEPPWAPTVESFAVNFLRPGTPAVNWLQHPSCWAWPYEISRTKQADKYAIGLWHSDEYDFFKTWFNATHSGKQDKPSARRVEKQLKDAIAYTKFDKLRKGAKAPRRGHVK